jgi:hypothetical protein
MSSAAATTVNQIAKFVFTNTRGTIRKISMRDFQPTKLDTGKWHRPRLSRLQFARFRKECLDVGITDHPFQKKEKTIKPVVFKGQKYLIKKQKRADIIAQKMKDMPVKLEEYYTNLRARRMRTYDPLYIIRHGYDRMKN